MSDFKISRLKYTWKGNWISETEYKPDDVIALGGKPYACLLRHQSSADFDTDLNFTNNDIPPILTPRWIKIGEGIGFSGPWQPNTYYTTGSVVSLQGSLYICLLEHTSAAQENLFDNDYVIENRWTLFVATDNWSQDWVTSTYYAIGSIVRYNGEIFRCTLGHTSDNVGNPGLYSDIAKWEKVSSSQNWKGVWNNSSLYRPRDVVRYGGNLYECVNQHGSSGSLLLNISDWQLLVEGFIYQGDFSSSNEFRVNEVVKYGAYLYVCIEEHQVVNDLFDDTKWQTFCPGLQYESVWSGTAAYEIGDIVRHGGYIYVAVNHNLNSEPLYDQSTTNANWTLLFEGTNITGEWSSTSSYLPGDIVRRGSNIYVAKTQVPAGQDVDLVNDGSTINSDYWELVSSGSLWKGNWTVDFSYVLDDVVLWRGASYKCIAKHTASTITRPDNDGGVHWDNLLYGDPRNVLSFAGDLKYFSNAGPTNLNVGTSGQTLQVSSTAPAWNDFNSSQATYYVSLNGIDEPNRGTTQNAPWRTVRYALDRITGPATLFIRTGTFEEILPLRVPASVAVVGDELRSTAIKPAENWFTPEDITRYSDIITFISGLLPFVIQGIPVNIQYGPLAKQSTSGSVGTNIEVGLADSNLIVINSAMQGSTAFATLSTNTISTDPDELAAAQQLENNLVFIQSEVRSWLDLNYPNYQYDDNKLNTTIERIITALVYDLRYLGNYKSIQAGQYFYYGSTPAVNKLSNMFLLGNATGLRNMTLIGLDGQLGPFNQYLTQRPSAGAYASLDPGWGPNDDSVWITARSPYVQNVTTFGNACIGLKVDGTLHDGGNKTIVCNDFTQILSDGIGVWCNEEGASEAVSVFTYYNHIGYLCTAGGKIRGTNGNCSYGKFGTVAEEFDPGEIPITATVNTRFFDAEVAQVFTDGNEILQIFWKNAGQNYTSASMSFTGAGINASLIPNEFRDQAIFETRIANPNDSTTPGGSGYTLSINNAQAGDRYLIQLSAADIQDESAYKTLRLVINSGTGAGQYGYIAAFDSLTKIALIGDERFAVFTVTETISTGDKIVIDYSNPDTTYGEYEFRVGDRVCFDGTAFGNLAKNTIYVISDFSSGEIELEDTLGNPITVVDATGTMEMYVLGFYSFRPGRTIQTTLNTTTSYQIEPRIVFSLPERDITNFNLPSIQNYTTGAYGNGVYVIFSDPGNSALYSTTGTSWSSASIPQGSWSKVAYGNGLFIAVSLDGKIISSTDGETWTSLVVPELFYSSVVYGDGIWIATALGGTTALRSTDGVSWTSVTLPEGADWTDIAYGKGRFVAVAQSDSTVTSTAYSSNGGLTWNVGSFLGGCVAIDFGNNRFVAIEGGFGGAQNVFSSTDGISWTASQLPSARNYRDIVYAQGQFIAISSTSASGIYYSIDGLRWATYTSLSVSAVANAIFFANDPIEPRSFLLNNSDTARALNLGTRAQARTVTASNRLSAIRIWEPGSGYLNLPTLDIIDPNNAADAFIEIRKASGVLASPTILNGGEGWQTVSTRATVVGDGFRDAYPIGNELIVDSATRIPGPGDNLRIDGIDDYIYRVLDADVLNGGPGNYQLRLLIAKTLDVNESPVHGTAVTIRQKYSQVRLTNHDFLDIGLGNFLQTNYPNTLFPNGTVVSPENEVQESNGGRVFYTSTDQDGNFRVGELFAVEQSTGTVTISADFFELEGLEELSIGGISVGGTGVVVREFSTDPLFVADSNNILSTQRAIKAYIGRRISGGGSDAFTSTFTAGIVRVGPNLISTTTLGTLNIPVKVNFNGPIEGYILAEALFLGGEGFYEG